MGKDCARLSAVKFGFAFGLFWGLGMLGVGWAGWLWNYGVDFINVWGSVYLGFKPTFVGGIIGGIWGFVDFFVFTWLVALVYNCCCGKMKSSESQSSL